MDKENGKFKASILILDDEHDVTEMLSCILKREGYYVVTVDRGEEAIEKAKKEKFDLAIFDIKLPGINGVKTLEEVKKIDPEIEIIMATGHASMESAIESMRKGACDYIEKPLAAEKVIFTIEKTLEKHQLKEVVALYEISKAIFSTIEMDALLESIVNLTMKVLRADDTSLMLFDEEGKLYIAISHGLHEEIKKKIRLRIGERIAGWVAESKEPVILINGLKNDARFKDIETRDEIKSSMVIPLIKNDKVLGILTANRINISDNFTESDLYKANIFFSLVSLALDNATLYNNLQKTLSDLKSVHEELRESQGQLVHSSKLASLGRLIADMAHEVNNPLMVVSGRAQLSLMEDIKNEEVKKNLKTIYEQSQKAKDIIQRLLRFSKPSKREFKDMDINKSVEEIVSMIEHQFALDNIKIRRSYVAKSPFASIDEKQLQEVFMNLLTNARDAISGEGIIEVMTSCERDFISINIKDSGSGMSEDTLAKIFDPFFTTKEKGTGLGLPVCYGIVKAHGGELKYESIPGEGTIATILLPIAKEGGG